MINIKAFRFKKVLSAFLAGTLNGLLGTGGGIPLWFTVQSEKNARTAFATASSGILILSAVSLYLHAEKSTLSNDSSVFFLWSALLGGALGAFLLKKVPLSFLRILFACLLIGAGTISLIRTGYDVFFA